VFCRPINWILDCITFEVRVLIGSNAFTNLNYDDDVAVPAHSSNMLKSALKELISQYPILACISPGERGRSKSLVPAPTVLSLMVDNRAVDKVKDFIYVGSIQASSDLCHSDIVRRIGCHTLMQDINTCEVVPI
jgi:hypothetical protein